MEYSIKNGYNGKLQSMLHDTAINGLNLDKLINDVSNVDMINYLYRIISSIPNIEVNEVISTAMNNAILMKNNDKNVVANVCDWITVMDKSFIKVSKLAINNAITKVNKKFKPNLIECLKYEMGDKTYDEPSMVALYNKVYNKSYKNIKTITVHDSDLLKYIIIEIDETNPKNKKFKFNP